ncbi:MAG: DNA replication and repair protein RecF [Cyclobacteriaceae bacterium]|nr:DNA replication and repair protein RecF [Cyclobacteriaceae bacterium]
MHLRKLRLFNFRNYREANISFNRRITCVLGYNGSGKTNLLEAIHFLALTKCNSGITDLQNINHNETQFSIIGKMEMNGNAEEVVCQVVKGGKKLIKVEEEVCERLSSHIGRYPLIMVVPNDNDLIRGGSELRRKFIDSVICQTNERYLEELLSYNRTLKQRNSFLKQFEGRNNIDRDLIAVYDNTLSTAGKYIHAVRKEFVVEFTPYVVEYYKKVSGQQEDVTINYESDLDGNEYSALLKENINRDLLLSRTEKGIHRDDYSLELNGEKARKFSSQGQQKSIIIALKLAQYQYIGELKGFHPLLLLDDIMDKLDDERISNLLSIIDESIKGQVFITDAGSDRLKDKFEAKRMEADWLYIYKGVISTSQRLKD